MNTVNRSDQTEVRLSVRDLLSLGGIALTIVSAMWAFSSDIKTTLATYGLRLTNLETRVQGIELKTVRESSPDYQELMRRWTSPPPTPRGEPPQQGDDGE